MLGSHKHKFVTDDIRIACAKEIINNIGKC